MNWYLQALKKYTVFTGRARRKEYWMFVLFNIIISAALSIVDYFTGTYNSAYGMGLLSGLYTLAVLLPGDRGDDAKVARHRTQRLVDSDRAGADYRRHLAPRSHGARQPAR